MPRYSGKLGVSEQQEVRPGIFEDVITEYDVLGRTETRTEALDQGDSVLPKYRTMTTVSVRARGLGQQDNSNIRYVTYAGKRFSVQSGQAKFPNLVLYLTEVYNGPTPVGAPSTP